MTTIEGRLKYGGVGNDRADDGIRRYIKALAEGVLGACRRPKFYAPSSTMSALAIDAQGTRAGERLMNLNFVEEVRKELDANAAGKNLSLETSRVYTRNHGTPFS